MEPPSKRQRLGPSSYGADEENEDELSMTPAQFDATQDPMYQLDKGRAKAATKLKSTFEDIFAKFGQDFEGDDDVINFYTDEIEVDNGHVQSLESRNDNAARASPSSDEEDRILKGKSGSRGKPSPSGSLVPVNHANHTLGPLSPSPWNEPLGLDTYRLSSLSFYPHGAHLPFDSGHPPFGFGHPPLDNRSIDPVWQTPDLPVQSHRQFGSLIGSGGSQFGSFGSPSHSAKRRVSAKSFLLCAASTHSKARDDNTEKEDDEDDILLGRNGHNEVPDTGVAAPERASIPATSSASPQPSSRDISQQPPFIGIDLVEDELHNKSDRTNQVTAQTATPESSMTETDLVSHGVAQGNAQHPHSPPPGHGGEWPKKLDIRGAATVSNEELKNEPRLLQPNERRIEVIIPMMKRLLPLEKEHVIRGTEPMADEIVQHLAGGGAHHSGGGKSKHPIQATQGPKHAAKLRKPQNSDRRRPKQTQKLTGPLVTKSLPQVEQHLDNAVIEVAGELESSPPIVDDIMASNFSDGLRQIERPSDCEDGHDDISPGETPSPATITSTDEGQAVHITGVEETMKKVLADKRNHRDASVRPLSPVGEMTQDTTDGATELPDPLATESAISITSMPQELESANYEKDDTPQTELQPSRIDSHDETIPIYLHAPDNTTTPPYDIHLGEVLTNSGVPTAYDIRTPTPEDNGKHRSPEHPSTDENTESILYHTEDESTQALEASETDEDQVRNTPNQLSFTTALATEIDGLQLNVDYQDGRRSPSLGAMELPDLDLSAFPTVSDACSASNSPIRSLSPSIQSDTQRDTSIGRSPSPELGTPIGLRIAHGANRRTDDSPNPTSPTRKRASQNAKLQSSHRRSPSSRRFPLSSLIPSGIDDESDDEISIAGSFSSFGSRLHSPFSQTNANDSPKLPPLLSTPRRKTGKQSSSLLIEPPSSRKTPNQTPHPGRGKNKPPATESRAGRSQSRRARNRTVHSSPLARTVAQRLLSSPTKKHRAPPTTSPGVVVSPHGTLRRCGDNGFVCERAFCLTCCK